MMTRILYEILFFLFALTYLPILVIKGKHKEGMGSRFGIVDRDLRERLSGKRVIWLHAVSVGEIMLAVRLAEKIHQQIPTVKIVFTTTTPAGKQVAQKLKRQEDELLYFPIDFRWSIRSFLNSIHPDVVAVLETEIWPNLIWELQSLKIPLVYLNARLSDKAYPKYRPIGFFLKPLLQKIHAIGTQDAMMRERFISLGANPATTHVTGNMKYDWAPSDQVSADLEQIRQWKKSRKGALLVAGSTHEGEEDLVVEAWQQVRTEFPHTQLVLAPRHMHRVEKLREKWSSPDLLLLDKMGVLSGLYADADIVFIGGSLVQVGGHNIIEPAYFEKPILFGPHMQNFKEISTAFLAEGAAYCVSNTQELAAKILSWLKTPADAQAVGRKAKSLVFQNQGAANKNAQMLVSLLKKSENRT